MTAFLIAGEASGDTHAARLMQAMKVLQSDIRFVGLGGDAMRREGAVLYQDYREMAFMGIFAVLSNLSKVRRNFKIAREALLKEKPDVLILIDYPSFNLRMAQFCREHLPATRIVYYIPPKVWVWKRWRVHKIARLCDEVLGIFPFEPDFYSRYGYKCTYIGNPTVEEVTSTEWRTSENVHNSRLYNVGIKCRRLEQSSSENVQKESSAPFGTGETESARQRQLQGYEEIANMLGKQNAAETAAKIILKHRE